MCIATRALQRLKSIWGRVAALWQNHRVSPIDHVDCCDVVIHSLFAYFEYSIHTLQSSLGPQLNGIGAFALVDVPMRESIEHRDNINIEEKLRAEFRPLIASCINCRTLAGAPHSEV